MHRLAKTNYWLVVLCLMPFWGTSQILDNTDGQLFTDEDFFNEKFISRNKVKRINAKRHVYTTQLKYAKNDKVYEELSLTMHLQT